MQVDAVQEKQEDADKDEELKQENDDKAKAQPAATEKGIITTLNVSCRKWYSDHT